MQYISTSIFLVKASDDKLARLRQFINSKNYAIPKDWDVSLTVLDKPIQGYTVVNCRGRNTTFSNIYEEIASLDIDELRYIDSFLNYTYELNERANPVLVTDRSDLAWMIVLDNETQPVAWGETREEVKQMLREHFADNNEALKVIDNDYRLISEVCDKLIPVTNSFLRFLDTSDFGMRQLDDIDFKNIGKELNVNREYIDWFSFVNEQMTDRKLPQYIELKLNPGGQTPENFRKLFFRARGLKYVDFSSLDTSNVKDMSKIFDGDRELTGIKWGDIDTSSVENISEIFSECLNLTHLDLSRLDLTSLNDASHMFKSCQSLNKLMLPEKCSKNIESMNYMFSNCISLESIDLSGFDTSKVKNMRGLFSYCSSLRDLNISNLNTSNVIDMSRMFCGCRSLRFLDLSNFNVSNVELASGLFGICESLEEINMSGLRFEKTGDFTDMFWNCKSLKHIDLSWLKYSPGLTYALRMFSECESIKEIDLSFIKPKNTYRTGDMVISDLFLNCKSLIRINLSGWDFTETSYLFIGRKGMEYQHIFHGCNSLKEIIMKGCNEKSIEIVKAMLNASNVKDVTIITE